MFSKVDKDALVTEKNFYFDEVLGLWLMSHLLYCSIIFIGFGDLLCYVYKNLHKKLSIRTDLEITMASKSKREVEGNFTIDTIELFTLQ